MNRNENEKGTQRLGQLQEAKLKKGTTKKKVNLGFFLSMVYFLSTLKFCFLVGEI